MDCSSACQAGFLLCECCSAVHGFRCLGLCLGLWMQQIAHPAHAMLNSLQSLVVALSGAGDGGLYMSSCVAATGHVGICWYPWSSDCRSHEHQDATSLTFDGSKGPSHACIAGAPHMTPVPAVGVYPTQSPGRITRALWSRPPLVTYSANPRTYSQLTCAPPERASSIAHSICWFTLHIPTLTSL